MATGGDPDVPNKRHCVDEAHQNDALSFTPREYQIEILETARKTNTIACLGTGTGKTFIAVLLIRENAAEVRIPYTEGGKRIFFLVPTVPLVNQQKKTITDHTDLKVGGYFGEMEVDSWNKDDWIKEFVKFEVLVMTAEIFRIILDHAFISPERIQLLVIDECHRAQKDHPYRQALKRLHRHPIKTNLPRIFGLSASLLNGKCKPTQLENRLKELSATMMSTITTASDVVDLRKYGTDPDEFVVYFSTYKHSAACLIKETNYLISSLDSSKSSRSKDKDICFIDSDVVYFDKPIKCLNSLCTTLSMLGPWCAHKAAEIYSREVETLLLRAFANENRLILKNIQEYLSYFMKECITLNGSSKSVDTGFLPDKLKRLLQIFIAAKKSAKFNINDPPTVVDVSFEEDPEKYFRLTQKNKSIKDSQKICSIIFVEQRITAYVLCQWLLEIKDKHLSLDFMKPDFIVGHGSVSVSETSMSEKLQRKKVKAFRDQECNVLVATCVLEEGMDIRQCNVVVRFDLPKDFRAYVQSKGRARARNSIYVLMVEDEQDKSKFLNDICNFKTIEEMLLSKCRDRDLLTDDEIAIKMASDAIPPYMPYGPEGPHITMSAAISVINRYSTSLPCDMATKLVPHWEIKKIDPNNIDTEYICRLRMPINSPLRGTIESDPMRRKRLAKMSAALKACQMLNEIGEMNPDLVPNSCLIDKALEDELGEIEKEEDNYGAKAGTNRSRRVYDKRVPLFLKNAKPVPGQPCFLHILDIDLIEPLPDILNPRRRPIVNPADSPRGLALLCSSRLPPVNAFPLFTRFGKILVDVKLFDVPIVLNQKQTEIIEEFHRFIFSDALWLEKGKMFLPNDTDNSYYIIPTEKDQEEFKIDWDFMKFTKENIYHKQKRCDPLLLGPTIFKEDIFHESVLMRSYQIKLWEKERPTFHHVIKLKKDMSPTSSMDSKKYDNFKDYYLKKYNTHIIIDDQPLVETVQYAALHLWKPIYLSAKETFDDKTLSKTKEKRKAYREYLVPELCIVHPFSSIFFLKVMCIPTILFRLHSLLLAEEIRQAVALEMQVGSLQPKSGMSWQPFHLEISDNTLRVYLNEKGILKQVNPGTTLIPRDIIKVGNYISSFEVNCDIGNLTGPSPSLLLQAMTTKSAGDEFDLERLEMIGDSFLKYAMSVKTYIKYYKYDEGKLTLLRSQLIQNLNLYQKAKKKRLGEYLTTTRFDCNNTWLPPCYNIHEYVDEKDVIKRPKKKSVQDAEDNETCQQSVSRDLSQDPEDNETKNNLHLYFTKQVISDKSIADSVEALIGAYLLSCGPQGSLRFMSWLGLKPLVNETDDFNDWPPIPPNPILSEDPNVNQRLLHFTSGFDRFEKIIKYEFKNKAYLLQAFTHPSYSHNDMTDCYQRLEFLGDAVLDYLITRQLYEDPHKHSPGKLTDLRSALVNNIFFATLAVSHEYNKFLKSLSPKLSTLINKYIDILCETEDYKFFLEHKYYLKEIECFELEEVEVPKALGDVFESVAGAIYLDSGMSLDAVWKVYFPMIKPTFDHLSKYVPISPVRELYELAKCKDLFGKPFEKNGRTYIKVILPDGNEFEGVGPNKKVAKKSAAKRALAVLKAKEQKMDVG